MEGGVKAFVGLLEQWLGDIVHEHVDFDPTFYSQGSRGDCSSVEDPRCPNLIQAEAANGCSEDLMHLLLDFLSLPLPESLDASP
eukprot:CAMPEP_0170304014 /NCGR_PEP_ID=MMETSP0116_2-20130129/52342_1 /TAXON_ID=400756 /ORGANISM="Durinskia baltica, Strain CSIRO CS-38" /LENGTH=83 /DNA_ID=CAMNT_0010555987 /DNA_START=15 /DNA_END=263 /DNA_ORIENTATION=-